MSSSQDSDGSSSGDRRSSTRSRPSRTTGSRRGDGPERERERTVAEKARRKGSEWEILGSLEKGVAYSIKPKRHEGFLSKRRKWPLKGWHKRYFVLDKGTLTYGKAPADLARGRSHGRIDVGVAVISAKTEMLRVDIDDEQYIHHLKTRDAEDFALWLEQLKQHRLYQQHQVNSGAVALSPDGGAVGPDEVGGGAGMIMVSPRGSLQRGMRPPGASSLWSQEFSALDEHMTGQLLNIQRQAVALALLAQKAEDEQNAALGGSAGNKSKKLFGLRKKKSAQKTPSNSSSAGDHQGAASRSSTLTGGNSEAVAAADADAVSNSSTLVGMSVLSNSNPMLAEQQALASGGGHRPVSLPSEGKRGSNASATSTLTPGSSSGVSSMSGAPLPSPASSSLTPSGSFSSGVESAAQGIQQQQQQQQQPAGLSAATRDEMLSLAQEIQVDVSGLMRSYTCDRDRLRSALEAVEYQQQMSKTGTLGGSSGPGSNVALIASLRQSLNQAMQQNSMLRARLQKIHLDSDLGDLPMVSTANVDTLSRGMNQSLSYSSSCISEFFDAREYGTDPDADSDEDSEEGETGISDSEDETDEDNQLYEEASSSFPGLVSGAKGATDGADLLMQPVGQASGTLSKKLQGVVGKAGKAGSHSSLLLEDSKLTKMTGRRQKLPIPKADTEGINLWNLLCKNIGKDLSKISMPVTLNEPLSALQRLCEELEYSELLDKAASSEMSDLDRMTWVAAFAVSVYGSCQARAGHKPFNPLLGETFECVREDRGFRYIAEQVSHHPPVSACHATSSNKRWTWAQDLRVKTKFWGKSMEFQPEGSVRLQLRLDGGNSELYEWNKITTCIHNLFGGSDRWVDLYGQLVIKSSTAKLTCKIDFVKASYWSNKRHELYGTITDKNGKVLQHLFGKWSEALYCGKAPSSRCIWRPAMLPADSDLYYGFSRFAIELNELLDNERDLLPHTDTRFRPDQRLLEEGQISEAENMKLRLEQRQRERRAEMESGGETHRARWFLKKEGGEANAGAGAGGGQWEFRGDYWRKREDPGFRKSQDMAGAHRLW